MNARSPLMLVSHPLDALLGVHLRPHASDLLVSAANDAGPAERSANDAAYTAAVGRVLPYPPRA